MVEGTRLESVRTLPGTGGSNPPLSAKWDCVEPQQVVHSPFFYTIYCGFAEISEIFAFSLWLS